jgi:Flp pilus assembly protein TadD
LKPANPSAHNNLGLALARLGRMPEAVAQFAAAVQLAPDYREARENLARAQAELSGAPP